MKKLLLILVLVLAGCGGNKTPSASSSNTPSVSNSDTSTPSSPSSPSTPASTPAQNGDWDSATKASMNSILGTTIPYISAFGDDYQLGEEEDELGPYIWLWAPAGSNSASLYETALENAGYDYYSEEVDNYGDTIYFYTKDVSKGLLVVQFTYYLWEGADNFELFAWIEADEEPVDPVTGEWDSSTKALMNSILGTTIPYIAAFGNDYDVYDDEDDEGPYIGIWAPAPSSSVNQYKTALLSAGFAYDSELVDEYGDTIYFYTKDVSKGELAIQFSYYLWEGEDNFELYAWIIGGGTEPVDPTTGEWDSATKAMMNSILGTTLPYLADFDAGYDSFEDVSEDGIPFLGIWLSFDASIITPYKNALSSAGYTDDGNYVDEYGDTWYSFYKVNGEATIYVDFGCYEYEGFDCFDIYAWVEGDFEPVDPVDPTGDITILPSTFGASNSSYANAAKAFTLNGVGFAATDVTNFYRNGTTTDTIQIKNKTGSLNNTAPVALAQVQLVNLTGGSVIVYGGNSLTSMTVITGNGGVYNLSGYTYFKITTGSSGVANIDKIVVSFA